MQTRMMDGILAFKDRAEAGPLRSALDELCGELVARGAGGLVLGCTELPVVLEADSVPVPCYNTLEILARAAVREALGDTNKKAARE
jgi:aspartate/glutamate racemase